MPPRPPRPITVLPLTVPAGAVGGFVVATLGYRLTQAGIHVGRSAWIISIFFLVQALRWLWAPLIDATLTRVRWYLAGWMLAIGAIAAMLFIAPREGTLALTGALVLCGSVGAGTMSTAVEGLIATSIPPSLKGRAAGWEWAGIFSGNCAGGGIALWLVQHANAPVASLTIGVISALCALPIRQGFAARTSVGGRLVERLAETVGDLAQVIRTPSGLLVLIVCVAPLGAGGSGNLFGAVAPDWHATADTVALVTGCLAPFMTAAGCVVGGLGSDTLGARRGYVVSGVALAGVALAMSAAPRTPASYVGFALAYQFAFGTGTAALAGLIFATIGDGAACTKCATFLGFGGLPGWYMTVLAGLVDDHLGAQHMLAVEGCVALASLLVLIGISRLLGTPLTTRR